MTSHSLTVDIRYIDRSNSLPCLFPRQRDATLRQNRWRSCLKRSGGLELHRILTFNYKSLTGGQLEAKELAYLRIPAVIG
jgi:hypothetical protein